MNDQEKPISRSRGPIRTRGIGGRELEEALRDPHSDESLLSGEDMFRLLGWRAKERQIAQLDLRP